MSYFSSQGVLTPYPFTESLDTVFRFQADRFPQKTAIAFGTQRITYAELDQQASAWAKLLQDHQLLPEEPVALLLEPGIDQIAVQLGILRAGGSCVPLDPAQPDARLNDMLESLETRLLVSSAQWQERLNTDYILLTDNLPANTNFKPVATTIHHRTHFLHTSGTTGRPKAVEVVALNILRLAFNREFSPLSANEVWAHISNPTFDASLYEIYGALLNGASLVVVPKQTLIDPYAFRDVIRSQKITAMCITTALFNLTALALPDAFTGVRHVLVGGEAANAHALREVLAHSRVENLRNAYGPTESVVYATSLHITPGLLDGKTTVSIGRAIDNTQVFILDENQRPVTGDQVGEIYLGGDGLARGYWKLDALNKERFVTLSISEGEQPRRLYRTGDLASWNEDGTIEYLGRADNQIKLRGHRIELQEIEAVLLSAGLLDGVVVDYIRPQTGEAEGYLLAYVVPADDDAFTVEPLNDLLKSRLPVWMLPRIRQVPFIPLNPNGKADRRALKALYVDEAPVTENALENEETLSGKIARLWRDILGIASLSQDDHFFHAGGSSLQAASLMLELKRRLSLELPISTLYEHPQLKTFSAFVQNWSANQAGLQVVDTVAALRDDARLADDMVVNTHAVPDWLAPDEGRVFVTGVTGFLGAFFLHDLLHTPGVQTVACLVRADNQHDGLARIRDNLDAYGLWNETLAPRIRVLIGNLGDETLGQGTQGFLELANWASVIFHLGAHVNYTQPYEFHREANVVGTLNILRLANAVRAKGVHYVSSIAAFGPTGFFTGTTELYEEESLELHLQSQKYDTGYSQSQWVAEQLVWAAKEKGMSVVVYRPGFIMGDSKQGIGNHKDFVARLIKGCILFGAFPRLEKQKKEFITVDYVSDTILAIAKNRAHYGHAYNLVPLHAKDSVSLLELHDMLAQSGYELELLPYARWVQRLAGHTGLADNPLLPLVPMLQEPVYGALTRWEVYENMPVYRTDNVQQVLGADAWCPTMNQALLDRYLQSWRESGFLPAFKRKLSA